MSRSVLAPLERPNGRGVLTRPSRFLPNKLSVVLLANKFHRFGIRLMSRKKALEIIDYLLSITPSSRPAKATLRTSLIELKDEINSITPKECTDCEGSGECRCCNGTGQCDTCQGTGEGDD